MTVLAMSDDPAWVHMGECHGLPQWTSCRRDGEYQAFFRRDGFACGYSAISVESRIGRTQYVQWRGAALGWWRVMARVSREVVLEWRFEFESMDSNIPHTRFVQRIPKEWSLHTLFLRPMPWDGGDGGA